MPICVINSFEESFKLIYILNRLLMLKIKYSYVQILSKLFSGICFQTHLQKNSKDCSYQNDILSTPNTR